MGTVFPPIPVKPVCAVTFTADIRLNDVMLEIEAITGETDLRGDIFDFNFTEYYSDEMGQDLRKIFIGFHRLMDPADLVDLKIRTNALEGNWKEEGRRRVNLDPGYVTGAKLILASTKDFAHRIFLGRGIYGDVQLQYRHGKWRPEAWTFPDYRTETALAFFEKARDIYNLQERRIRNALP
jgi:hypothetical protein